MEIKDVGQRIAKLRKASGWSQMELAEKLNVSDKTVSKWENGGMPSIDLLPGLSSLFGVSIDYLLTGNDKKEPEVKEETEEKVEETPAPSKETVATPSAKEVKNTNNNESAFDHLDRNIRLPKKLPNNYVCPKCKKVNLHPDDHCIYCYHTFSWDEYMIAPQSSSQDGPLPKDYVCPRCGRINHNPGVNCQYCYHDFTKSVRASQNTPLNPQSYFKSAAPKPYRSYNAQEEPAGCLAYGVAFLIPIAGLIWGFKKNDKGLKIFSAIIMALNLIAYLALL